MKPVRTILILTLCLLVLVSGSSFIIGLHLCSGNVQNLALFTQAEGCMNEKKVPPCHKQESKPCCEDETIVHKAVDLKASISDIHISPAPLIDSFLPSTVIAEIIPSAPVSRIEFYNYDPPLRSYDLTVSLQVFLI